MSADGSGDVKFVVFVNGIVLIFLAVLMGLDGVIFPATMIPFASAALGCGFPGVMLVLSARPDHDRIHRLHGFLLTVTVWITAGIAGALPLALWALPPVDALFESVSGITTTGSTLMSGLDTAPRGIILWRAELQALGGIGFIVTGIALLPFLRVGGMQLFRTESSEKGDRALRNAALFAAATLQVYFGMIVLCAVVYMIGGMSLFDAATHAMTTLSTGGYSGYDASFGHFTSPFLQWACTLFMLLGGLPFAWYIRAALRGRVASEQVQAMLVSLAIVIALLTLWLVVERHEPPLTALRLVAFNVVSIVTTTGFATTDYTLWGAPAVVAFFLLTAVGGCTGSTAGGIKAMRWLVMLRGVRAQVQRVYQPSRVVSVRYEGRRVDEDTLGGVMGFFYVFAATFLGLAAVLAAFGLDLPTAVSGALTALANVGPGVGGVIGPAGNFATLSPPVKIILTVAMLVGRLELLTFFILLTPAYWRALRF